MIVKGERASALTSSGVQITGQDASAVIKRVIERAAKRQEEGELRMRMQDERWKYDLREEIHVFMKVEGDPACYVCESVGEVPGIGKVLSTQPNMSARMALADFRLELAKAWSAMKLCKSYEEARERCSKVDLRQSILKGVG